MNGAPREETEEEYDARLEREEKERIEAAKRRHLEELKRRYQEDEAKRRSNAPEDGQVRFKGLYWINIFSAFFHLSFIHLTGRGRMKYVDPEIRASRDGRDRYD